MSCEKIASFNNIEEAIDCLAKRAAVGRLLRREQLRQQKSANIGESALEFLKNNPTLASTLLGGAAGAGIGGISGVMSKDPERTAGRSALTGAIAGSALGFGGSLAGKGINAIRSSNNASFPDSSIINRLNIPAIIKNPEAVTQMEKLKEPSLPGKIINNTASGIWNYTKNHPILTALMTADMLGHTAGYTAGQMTNLPGTRANVFTAGLKRYLTKLKDQGDHTKGMRHELFSAFKDLTPDAIKKVLLAAREAGAESGVTVNGIPISTAAINNIYSEGFPMGAAPRFGQGISDWVSSITGEAVKGDNAVHFSGKAPKGLKMNPRLNSLFGKLESFKVPTTLAGNVGARAALYAGVPMAEYALGELWNQRSNKKQIEELINNFTVKK